jgi:hypothetical protein
MLSGPKRISRELRELREYRKRNGIGHKGTKGTKKSELNYSVSRVNPQLALAARWRCDLTPLSAVPEARLSTRSMLWTVSTDGVCLPVSMRLGTLHDHERSPLHAKRRCLHTSVVQCVDTCRNYVLAVDSNVSCNRRPKVRKGDAGLFPSLMLRARTNFLCALCVSVRAIFVQCCP